MSQVWTMELTASINFCYICDSVVGTVKVKSKKSSWETMIYFKRLRCEWAAIRE